MLINDDHLVHLGIVADHVGLPMWILTTRAGDQKVVYHWNNL